MNDRKYIFLSYRTLESDFAIQLAADLKNSGVMIWMDRLDGIEVGMEWRKAIEDAINECAAMIAIVSPEYVAAEYCKKELARANRLNRPILPVLLRQLDKKSWPLVIEGVQFEDFTAWPDRKVYYQNLKKFLQRIKSVSPNQLGELPDIESRYLTTLIAELESHKGVLEYVDLSSEAEANGEIRPEPSRNEGWAPEFELLIDFQPTELPPVLKKTNKTTLPLKNILEAIHCTPRFVLLGDPGGGKTTTIRKLALDNAHAYLDNPRQSTLPLFLSLPTWKDEPTPLDFIQTHWPFNSDPLQSLVRGDVFLYLDGLNEMGVDGPVKVKKLGSWLQSLGSTARIIITCRLSDYTTKLSVDLPAIKTKEMNENQMKLFALNYIGDKDSTRFISQLSLKDGVSSGERSLFDIARNPYLLAALIYIYQKTPGGTLPTQTGLLFQHMTQALWMREKLKQTFGWIPLKEMRAAFSRLAYNMINENMPVEVPMEYVLKHIQGSDLIHAGQSANLVIENNQHVRFYHQLLQEYFAAIYIFQGGHNVRELVKDKKWKYVIVMWSSFIENPEHLLLELTFTEARSFTDAGYNVPLEVRNLLQSLNDGSDLGSSDPHDLNWIQEKVKEAGKLSTPYLLKALQLDDADKRGHAVMLLGLTGDASVVPALVDLLSDKTSFYHYHFTYTICNIASESLLKIGTPEALSAVEKWKLAFNRTV